MTMIEAREEMRRRRERIALGQVSEDAIRRWGDQYCWDLMPIAYPLGGSGEEGMAYLAALESELRDMDDRAAGRLTLGEEYSR